MFCTNCGNELPDGSAFCPKCGTKVGGTEAVVASTSVTKINSTESYFDGGVLQRFGWSLLGGLVTSATFGILYPLAICWLYEWEAKHTVIDGHRLKFTGSAGGLFGTWILCWFLTLITFGIYGFWVPLKIRKWRESNTFFEDEIPNFSAQQNLRKEKASYFDGGLLQLIGWSLLGAIVTVFTVGICYPWAVQMLYSWEQRHKVYCKKRCNFDGTATGLFVTWMLCLLLAFVTLGIYCIWIPIKIKKWQIKHTHLLQDETAAEEQETKGLTEEEKEQRRIAKEKQTKQLKKIGIGAGIVFVLLCVVFHNHVGYIVSHVVRENLHCGHYYSSLEHYKLAKIKKVKVPEGTKKIEDNAFDGWYSLKEVTIPDSVTIIGNGAFSDCYSLTSVTIPDSVTIIGNGAFSDCRSLTSVTIPDSVTIIGNDAFSDCYSLTSVTIPDGVTTIGKQTFFDCYSLASVTIPDGVTTIGEQTFFDCRSLTSVTIPDSVTTIGEQTFFDCYSLTSVTIPDSVREIGGAAFSDCESLTIVNYRGSKEQWKRIEIDYDNGSLKTAKINFNYTGE